MPQISFDKLVFQEGEQEEFKRFVLSKGEYLHKQVYDVLITYNDQEVTYYEMSSIIRYDKNLRDKLYIFLATFEEYLRAKLFSEYDVEGCEQKYKGNSGLDSLKADIKKKKNREESNLYFAFGLELGPTIKLVEHLKMFDDETISDLRTIKDLRNNVMHHNLLILGGATNKAAAENNINLLKTQIETLCKHLPEEYRNGFRDNIDKLKKDPKTGQLYLSKLYLEDLN